MSDLYAENHQDDPPDPVQCPRCGGQGVFKQWPGDRSPEQECDYCFGKTVVSEARAQAYFDDRKG